MITRQNLAIIQAVHRHGTVTEAAQSLHLTQSALTHQVKNLEQRLQCTVWQKEGRTLRFTQTGRYLLALANRVLPQFEQAEAMVKEYAAGHKGMLRIGMECHPCYQWFLKLVRPFWQEWANVDLDVKQKFQFGGIAALLNYDIDLLITPDPIQKSSLKFEPVFAYEQVLVVYEHSPLAQKAFCQPEDLLSHTLITYPVPRDRLDIFTHFLQPQGCLPHKHKQVESTDIMLEMVAANKGVAALPSWLAHNYAKTLPISTVKLGEKGVDKSIYIAYRATDASINYLAAFIDLAKQTT